MNTENEIIETLLHELQRTANFMRGMRMDPRLHPEIKEAIQERVDRLDNVTAKYAE